MCGDVDWLFGIIEKKADIDLQKSVCGKRTLSLNAPEGVTPDRLQGLCGKQEVISVS
jgi:hypothetical protein